MLYDGPLMGASVGRPAPGADRGYRTLRPGATETLCLRATKSASRLFAVADDVYRPLVRDALAFFYLQRSGIAIDERRAPGYGRPGGHADDVAVEAWTGPDARRLYPGWSCRGRFDVSGGWYDAGDYGKYVVSGSLPAWQLLDVDPRECRWQLDWLLRMLVPDGQPLAGMANWNFLPPIATT